MALISPTDQTKLREVFGALTRTVHLLFFTQTLDCETCLMTRQILDELPPLSARIAIDEVNFVLEGEKAKQYGVDRVPAIAVAYENADGTLTDTRMRFLGAPAGYEFMTLIQAVLLAGGQEPSLTPANRERVAAVDRPVTIQVFTTPS